MLQHSKQNISPVLVLLKVPVEAGQLHRQLIRGLFLWLPGFFNRFSRSCLLVRFLLALYVLCIACWLGRSLVNRKLALSDVVGLLLGRNRVLNDFGVLIDNKGLIRVYDGRELNESIPIKAGDLEFLNSGRLALFIRRVNEFPLNLIDVKGLLVDA